MCAVLNKHAHGIPSGAQYIGRGSKWGNPFRIGPDGSRAEVIAKHAANLRGRPDLLRARRLSWRLVEAIGERIGRRIAEVDFRGVNRP